MRLDKYVRGLTTQHSNSPPNSRTSQSLYEREVLRFGVYQDGGESCVSQARPSLGSCKQAS